jgi:hypothetical protein
MLSVLRPDDEYIADVRSIGIKFAMDMETAQSGCARDGWPVSLLGDVQRSIVAKATAETKAAFERWADRRSAAEEVGAGMGW